MYTILRTILIIKRQVFKPSKISTKILKGVNLSHWEVEKFSFSHIIVTFVGKKKVRNGVDNNLLTFMMQTCLKRPENLNYNKTWFMKAISLGDNFMAMLELLYI